MGRQAKPALGETQISERDTKLRALVIPLSKEAGSDIKGQSKAKDIDPWAGVDEVISPPFDPLRLLAYQEYNRNVESCIGAMEVNISGYGHKLRSRIPITETNKSAVISERVKVDNFLTYCGYTEDISLTQIRRRIRRDLELTGNGWYEVLRSASGEICGLNHLPSHTMRLTKKHNTPVDIDKRVPVKTDKGGIEWKTFSYKKKFRRYVQGKGGERVWFKQFGDSRNMNSDTGIFDGEDGYEKDNDATEVIHLKLYTSRSPYGLPRWIGQILSMDGDRGAEEINYITFKNNNVPSLAFLCAGGQFTQGSIDRITTFMQSVIQGQQNYSKALVIEAEPFDTEDELDASASTIKMEIKELTKSQHQDELFQNYGENNRNSLRRSFRLPPIYLGDSEDYTRATADASVKLGDQQVFDPERRTEADVFNLLLFPAMGILYHTFEAMGPNVTNDQDIIKILERGEKSGGVTPALARFMIEDILGRDLSEFPISGVNMDEPFTVQMAERVKSMANPGEPGQTVTAIKSGAAEAVEGLMLLRSQMEAEELERYHDTEDDNEDG